MLVEGTTEALEKFNYRFRPATLNGVKDNYSVDLVIKSDNIGNQSDAAYFENDITNTKNKLFGFGVGFGLLTKAGLFKLNYSSGKTENIPFKLSNSKIHVSLTATF